jgi:nucleoid-associated protein YgaU
MTRETKIGLLVGLAFIIVVAILLSDPVNNASEPQAAITDTLGTVQKGLTVPAPTAPPAGDRSTTAIITPNRAASREPILMRTEIEQQNAQTEVKVSAPTGPVKPIIPVPSNDGQQVAVQQGSSDPDNAVVTPPTHTNTDSLQQAGTKGGEAIVPTNQHDPIPPAGSEPAPAPTGKQHYVAQAGDTLNKMAARLMGANTKANRAAIIAANPSLKQNPDRVTVGASYVIPGAATAATSTPEPTDTVAQAPAPAPDNQSGRWYVVKPNDNLWRIAANEVGDASAVSEIISLNKDVLKGGSTLQPNMRLRLPPKTVASAD